VSDLFLRACRRQPVERVPVWMMRQAGRYLPEYRRIREQVDFLTLCRTPDLAAQVTVQPVDRLGVDAAILFSDILVVAEPLGLPVTFDPGPRLGRTVRSAADLASLRPVSPEDDLAPVLEAVRQARRALHGRVPLIGFAAAPFTLAAYLVEGRGTKDFAAWRAMLHAAPGLAHALLDRLAAVTADYLLAQARAGAQALQLFDSWAGLCAAPGYREFGLRHARAVIDRVREADVPVVYFALGAAHLLEEIRDCGADVVGVDWRVPLSQASQRLDHRFVLQGNLDPCALLAPPESVAAQVRKVLDEGASAPGHVFNLGHGVLPETPVEHAQAVVETVRQWRVPARAVPR
jgi:uroporphyrinogen decarboxylase